MLAESAIKKYPALKKSLQTGILFYKNPQIKNIPDKDAILVLSFGTTNKQARQNDIENIVYKIRQAYPHTKVVLAFTSHIIIKRIKKTEELCYDTPEKALTKLHQDGYTRVVIITLDIIPGIEYNYKQELFFLHKNNFKSLVLSTPLLYWMGQKGHPDEIKDVLRAFLEEFSLPMKNSDAVLIFTHGTPHPANAYYTVMQDRLNKLGKDNVFIYTAEGYPELSDVIPILKKNNYKKILLLPFLIVSGVHVNEDMAGKNNSHKTILEQAGFEVSTYLHGLGESNTACKFFLDHTKKACELLTNK
ncbi:sirohydrochlorin cobaltochelatase [Pectinatus sottacetonis]|uniref:sirohydrochlorin cobaltochelatase n=1 Tax=Pectinatus sottacetonis TaxID=1002795 RepID=UPI0018C70B1E|nr:sirohydrochlorin cobaltochelatase [Pectinatus sottacetonis]